MTSVVIYYLSVNVQIYALRFPALGVSVGQVLKRPERAASLFATRPRLLVLQTERLMEHISSNDCLLAGFSHPSSQVNLTKESTVPRYLLLLREGLNFALSHPLNVLVDQFASQSTVPMIALFVFYVNNVMA